MPALKNPKHENVVRHLLEGKSAGDAYQSRYDDAETVEQLVTGMVKDFYESVEYTHSCAPDAKVAERLAELQEEIVARVPVTIASLIQELEQARTQATGKNQFAAAIKAILGKAVYDDAVVVFTVQWAWQGCGWTISDHTARPSEDFLA